MHTDKLIAANHRDILHLYGISCLVLRGGVLHSTEEERGPLRVTTYFSTPRRAEAVSVITWRCDSWRPVPGDFSLNGTGNETDIPASPVPDNNDAFSIGRFVANIAAFDK